MEFNENVFELIGEKWMLITAKNGEKWNTMTASWGAMGILWGKPVVFVFIRPTRFTYEFVEKTDYFTCSFFGDEYKTALKICGSKSGRDIDKAKETGLTPKIEDEFVSFSQANLTLKCKKLYFADLDPKAMLDMGINENYPNKDYHRMYVAEIIN